MIFTLHQFCLFSTSFSCLKTEKSISGDERKYSGVPRGRPEDHDGGDCQLHVRFDRRLRIAQGQLQRR